MKKLFPYMLPLLVMLAAEASEPDKRTHGKAFYQVLLIRWKPGMNSTRTVEMKRLWQGLSHKLKGFESFEIYPLDPGEFDEVAVLRFTSAEAYRQYERHLDHQKIKVLGPRLIEDFSSYSYHR